MGDTPASIPETVYREYQAGNLPREDYFVMSAAWVCDNSFKYPARAYTPLSQSLTSYVQGRLNSRIPVDADVGQILGEWAHRVHQLVSENSSNLSLLLWSMEKCESRGLADKAEKLARHIKQYEANHLPEGLNQALQVMQLDARDRKRPGAA